MAVTNLRVRVKGKFKGECEKRKNQYDVRRAIVFGVKKY